MQPELSGNLGTRENQGIQGLIRHIGEPDVDKRLEEWIAPLRASEPKASHFLPDMQDVILTWLEKNPIDAAEREKVQREVRDLCEAVLRNTGKWNQN